MREAKPAEAEIALVLQSYWNGHASKIASHQQAKAAIDLWSKFWGGSAISDLTVQRQEEFIAWLKQRGYKNAYVSRVMSVGRAALNRAWKRQEIVGTPYIIDEHDRSDAREPYRLNPEQMSGLLDAAKQWPHFFTFCMISLNTLARPDAVLDLRPAQVDLDLRRIDLNPPGRRQTKKYRPVVPITGWLLPLVQDRDCLRFVLWQGKPVQRIKGTFARAVTAAGLPASVTPYALRHTMATELRRRSVPAWEVSAMLGHSTAGTSEAYAKYDPSYLAAGAKAIDDYFKELTAGPVLGWVGGRA